MQGSGKSTGLAIHKIPAKKRLGISRPLLRCYTSYLFLFFIRRWLTIIHQPSAPPAKFIALGFHQLPLLLCGQLFDLCLPPGRRDLIRQILQIRRFHRQMASCIFRTFSVLVCCQPFFKIIGPAGVERAVFAAEHIDTRRFAPSFFVSVIDRLLHYILYRNPRDRSRLTACGHGLQVCCALAL